MDSIKKNILKDYIKYKKLSVKSDKIKDMEFYMKKFLESSSKDIRDFTEKELLNFLEKENSNYKTSSFNNIKAYCKNFIKWHFEDWSLRFRNLDRLCRSQKPPRTYTPEQMIKEDKFEKLIKAEESFFWKAYFLTLFYGGCRPIEVCNLKWEDVEFEESGAYITIYSNKNKTKFVKFLPEKPSWYLKQLKANNSKWVFFNKTTKKPISRKGAYWKVRQLSRKVFGKEIDLLTLRHSIATILYNKDNLKDDNIAKQMGHQKSMKGVYVENDLDKIKEIARGIYFEPENLAPERKHKLELEMEEQKKKIDVLLKDREEILNYINKDRKITGIMKKQQQIAIKKLNEQGALIRVPPPNLME